MTGRGRLALLLFLALGCAGAVAGLIAWRGGSPAGTESGWSSPEPIPGPGVGLARVAVAPDGRTLAAWSEERRGRWSLHVAERPAGEAWGEPTTIASGRPWTIRVDDVRANGRGESAVLFTYYARGRTVALAAVRPADRAWESPQAVMPVQQGIVNAALALDDAGGVTVAWGTLGGGGGVNVTRRAPDGRWQDPVRVAAASGVGAIQASSAGDHVAVVAEIQPRLRGGVLVREPVVLTGGPSGPLRILRRTPFGGPGAVQAVVTPEADGRLFLTWREADARGTPGRLLASRRAGAGWSAPVVLDRRREYGEPAEVLIAGERTVVAWARWERARRAVAVRSAVLDAAGRVVARLVVDPLAMADARGPGRGPTPPSPPPVGPRIAGRDGEVTLLWTRTERTASGEPGRGRLVASDLSGASWSAPVKVAEGPSFFYIVAFEGYADGLLAAWPSALDDGRTSGLRFATRGT